MKTLMITVVMLLAIPFAVLSNGQLKPPKNFDQTSGPDFTAYGRAVLYFYPSGSIRKIRCRSPHDVICFTIEYSTGKLDIYTNGNIIPAQTIYAPNYSVGNEEGDVTIELPEN